MSALTLDLWGEQEEQEKVADEQPELPLMPPKAKAPTHKKEPGELTDMQLFEDEPRPSEQEPGGSPAYTLRLAYWRLWKALYMIDSSLARQYRGPYAPDPKALAPLVNVILFGVESDRPLLTPERADRVTRAHSFVAKYLSSVRLQTKWEPVGLGDAS